MPRLSSKNRYILSVFELYKEQGLGLNMEQIANSLNITKKTLYNNFESKEDMMRTVVAHFFSTLETKMLDSIKKSENAIEALFQVSSTIRNEIDKLGTVLLDDIAKENVDMFLHSNRSSFYSKVIMENLQRGINEGLYRENINIEYVTLFYTSAIEMFYKSVRYKGFMKKSKQFHSELVKHHLYSIVRPESINLLDSYL